MKTAALIFVMVLGSWAEASAEEAASGAVAQKTPADTAKQAPRSAVDVSLAALSVRALSVAYERQLPFEKRLSLGTALGLRRGALGDYSSTTLAFALEARWWWTGRAPWLRFAERTLAGWYSSFRIGFSSTTTDDKVDDRRIGSTWSLSETIGIGYRFVLWHRFGITPQTGMQLRHDFDRRGELPPWTQFSLTFGLMAGAVF